jgi:bifunctional non-homologous end joining protein LigD
MVNTLGRYNEKRNFNKTPEPAGKYRAKSGYGYLIQKHAASHLHYDFRLELNGVLKSWAVTKGPSLDPHTKRLAVEVEDHPVAYGSFEGTIPKGEYGGGTVMLWDTGTWEPIGDPEEQIEQGKLSFYLHGERLKGEWSLVLMRGRKQYGKKNWLLIKKDDEYAIPDDEDEFLKEETTSVVSNRSMEAIAAAEDNVWKNNKANPVKKKLKNSAIPTFIPPELATLSDKMPESNEWVHEIKFDGYRIIARIENGEVVMLTRNGNDWTNKFPTIAKELEKFPVENAIIDGEIVVVDEDGRSNFLALQDALSADRYDIMQYYVFDILYLNNENLTADFLLARKEKLQQLMHKASFANIFYSEHFKYRENFLDKICNMNFEGIISKLANKPYYSGRNKYWLKSKCHKRQEFVIGGFKPSTASHDAIGSLLLGVYENGEFIYCGKVGTGFTHKSAVSLYKQLEKLKQSEPPFVNVSALGKRGAIWVKPELVCEVEFLEWTNEGALRHSSFQGLRFDKPPEQIHKEMPLHLNKHFSTPLSPPPVGRRGNMKKKQSEVIVAGIKITHPERVVYPKLNLTKLDLVNYYNEVADYIMPYLENRPISLVRCPDGLNDGCFFQRHEMINSDFIHQIRVNLKNEHSPYLYINDIKGLITLIQFGVMEIHIWGSKIDKIMKPDTITFDLDPDPETPWERVVEAAAEVKLRLDDLGLESFLKITGGKGLHVIIPIKPRYGWDVIKPFAKTFAEQMAQDSPDRYVSNMSKAKRKGKIFIDYLRNDQTATSIAPFSARAREFATVAIPISWWELDAKLDPRNFTIETVPEILKKLKEDPWKNFWNAKQEFSNKLK